MKISEKIPTYYMRFEDLRTDPVSTLLDCFRFILDQPSLQGTVVEKRIKERCSLENQPKSSYKLKSTSSSLCRNQAMYSPEQIELLKEILKEYNLFYGYTNHPDINHNTAFFNYTKQSPDDLSQFKAFQKRNEESLSEVFKVSEKNDKHKN